MKTPIVVLASLIAASALAAVAADPPKKELTPQQQRMSECSKDSKGMKGEEHKKFMSDCLKGGPGAADAKGKLTPQQERMKECNAEAAGKGKMAAGDRQKFMSECLKADHPMGGGGMMKGPPDKGAGGKMDPKLRMKECNADASKQKLKGEEHKKFMSDCLKG